MSGADLTRPPGHPLLPGPDDPPVVAALLDAAWDLHAACARIIPDLPAPVAHTHSPLAYAPGPHAEWIRRYAARGARTVMLGMNPGPWGMGQTGVPFGDPAMVMGFLDLHERQVDPPAGEVPKRPVIGFESHRREASGTRVWGFMQQVYGTADAMAERLHVVNHCPVLFYDEAGRNLTPDRFRGPAAEALQAACDTHLATVVAALGADEVIGFGKYAEAAAQRCLGPGGAGEHLGAGVAVKRVPHPSPASPLANRNGGRDWREAMAATLDVELHEP